MAQPMNGDLRTSFVESGVTACKEKALKSLVGNEAFFNKLGITEASITEYCYCTMIKTADTITPDEFASFDDLSATASWRTRMAEATLECRPLLKRKVPTATPPEAPSTKALTD
jgi:hypothetical protein